MPTFWGDFVARFFRDELPLDEIKKQHYALTKRIPRFIMNMTRCSHEDAQDIIGHGVAKFYVAAVGNIEKQTPAYFRVVLNSAVATVLGKKHRKAEVQSSLDPDNESESEGVLPGLVEQFMAKSGEELKSNDLVFDHAIIGQKLIEAVKKTDDPDVACICEMMVMVVGDNPLGSFKTVQHDVRELMRKRMGWSEKRLRNAMLRASRNPQFKVYQSQRAQLLDAGSEPGAGD